MPAKWIFLSLVILPLELAAQTTTVIHGEVRDQESGEVLAGATIHVPSADIGVATNSYGFYVLDIPPSDSVDLVVAYLGYDSRGYRVPARHDQRLDVRLQPSAVRLDEILVRAEPGTEGNVRSSGMGVVEIPVATVLKMPSLAGEADILKVLQLLPGVQAAQEGTTGYAVRGGQADQNLVLLDGAPVYNPSHLLGLVSTFNPRALHRAELIRGGFPARYGGRLSSILDLTMREGHDAKLTGQAGIGLLASHLTVEGPIQPGRTSFILSGRRTYLDLLLQPFLPSNVHTRYAFHDINAKVNTRINNRDRLYVSYFRGRDDARYRHAANIEYGLTFGNETAALRWNRLSGKRTFFNTSLLWNQFNLKFSAVQSGYSAAYVSRIRDLTFRTEAQSTLPGRQEVRAGVEYTYHAFQTSGKDARLPQNLEVVNLDFADVPHRYSHEWALFAEERFRIYSWLGISAGLRVPGYFRTGEPVLWRLEPRLTARVMVTPSHEVRASWTIMNQFVHLIPGSTAALPTDIWTPATRDVPPQSSRQIALGYSWKRTDINREITLEGYYKTMAGQILLKPGGRITEEGRIDDELIRGNGWSTGLECLLRHEQGRLAGWISYTLSWTWQKFDELNEGKAFPYRYDRRHNIAVAATWRWDDRWSLSGNFVFTSGGAITLPTGRVLVSGAGDLYAGIFADYTNYNNQRMGAYHRLDLNASYRRNVTWFGLKPMETELQFGAYNIYSRLNPYFVYLDVRADTGEPVARQVSLLPVLPSISYHITF